MSFTVSDTVLRRTRAGTFFKRLFDDRRRGDIVAVVGARRRRRAAAWRLRDVV